MLENSLWGRFKYIKSANVGVSLFETEESRTAARQTYIVAGVARGGTTSITGILRLLGLNMGEDLQNNLRPV